MGQSVEMMMVMFGSLEGRVEWILWKVNLNCVRYITTKLASIFL